MTIKIAKRQAVPLMIGIGGTSGSGKTYSALLMAAGLAGENGKVGFLDTELGRGSMYADDPDIKKAMPGGIYYISDVREPFTPDKYAAEIKDFIKEGVNVLVIDSITHEWDGFGGCCDIAENNKLGGMPNWAMAKMKHKRLMNLLVQCPMHIIFCLRAREKTKPIKNPNTGKMEIVQEGLQPIQEKNFMFEMTLAMLLNEEAPGKPKITKCPKPLLHLFLGENSIITKEIGDKLLDWSSGGESIDVKLRDIERECREEASFGTARLTKFYSALEQEDKNLFDKLMSNDFKNEVKESARAFDKLQLVQDEEKEPKKLDLTKSEEA